MFIYLNWRCDHLPIYCLQNKTIREWQSVFPLWKFHWTSFELTQKCTFRMVGCRNSWFLWFYALLISFVWFRFWKKMIGLGSIFVDSRATSFITSSLVAQMFFCLLVLLSVRHIVCLTKLTTFIEKKMH